MKTHALERITGAVKNSYGFIYGLHKAKGHTLFPSADSFARMLIDLNQCVNPRLYIMDGITAVSYTHLYTGYGQAESPFEK